MPVQAVRKSAVRNPVLKECSMCTRPPFCQVLQFEASFIRKDAVLENCECSKRLQVYYAHDQKPENILGEAYLKCKFGHKQQDPDKIQKVKIENPIENFLLMPLFG